jgi:DNA-binding MarR family transcriptional regulator
MTRQRTGTMPTVTDDPWLDETEQLAWRKYLRMHRLLFAHLVQHQQREFGLSAADYEIMVNLSEAPRGRMRAFELGESTLWEKSRLSHHLKRMEQRGLVCREATGNSRSPDILLTDAGRAAITEAAPAHASHVRAWFTEVLGPERLAVLAESSDAVLAALESHDCPLSE